MNYYNHNNGTQATTLPQEQIDAIKSAHTDLLRSAVTGYASQKGTFASAMVGAIVDELNLRNA